MNSTTESAVYQIEHEGSDISANDGPFTHSEVMEFAQSLVKDGTYSGINERQIMWGEKAVWAIFVDDDLFAIDPTWMELTDEEQVEAWMKQPAPAIDELTEDDVLAAYLAKWMLSAYQIRGIYPFELDRAMPPAFDAEEHAENLRLVQRGFAVLSGYLLRAGVSRSIFHDLPIPKESVMHRIFAAGYVAMEERHRLQYLVPADDLVTITEAAEILTGKSTQASIVKVSRHIADNDLQLFLDRTENNPQRHKRVSRQDVERLRRQWHANQAG